MFVNGEEGDRFGMQIASVLNFSLSLPIIEMFS